MSIWQIIRKLNVVLDQEQLQHMQTLYGEVVLPHKPPSISAELAVYFSEPAPDLVCIDGNKVIHLNPLQWWKKAEPHFPHVAALARHYFSMLATSVPSERAFSLAGWIMHDRRCSLTDGNFGTLVFLNANAQHLL